MVIFIKSKRMKRVDYLNICKLNCFIYINVFFMCLHFTFVNWINGNEVCHFLVKFFVNVIFNCIYFLIHNQSFFLHMSSHISVTQPFPKISDNSVVITFQMVVGLPMAFKDVHTMNIQCTPQTFVLKIGRLLI